MKLSKNYRHTAVMISALLMAVILVVTAMVVPYGDDFYYGNAFGNYWQHRVTEYTQNNGRIFVHVLDELTLLADTYIYRAIAPLFLLFSAVFAAGFTQDIVKKPRSRSVKVMFSLALFLFLQPQMLRESYLWITGMFNYLFPIFMAFLAAICLRKRVLFGENRWYFAIIAFLAGATTEQGGLIAITLMLGSIFFAVPLNKLYLSHFKLPLYTAVGWLTVMLAPGVFARAGRMGEIGLGEKLWENFELRAFEIMGDDGFLIIVCAVLIFASTARLRDVKKQKIIRGSMAVGGFLLIGTQFIGTTAACIIAILTLGVVAFLLMSRVEYKCPGIFILVALLSQGIMLPVAGSSYRTTFAAALFLIFAASELLSFIVKDKRSVVAVGGIVSVIGLWAFSPTLWGYMGNKEIHDQNIANTRLAKTSGKLEYNTDIDRRYGYMLPFDDGYYYSNFIDFYDLNEDVEIIYKNDNYTNLYGGDAQCQGYLYYEGGLEFLPMRDVIEVLGGSVSWKENATEIELMGGKYILDHQTTGVLTRESDGQTFDFTNNRLYLGKMYYESESFLDAFGLKLVQKGGGAYVEFRQ